MAQWRKVLLFNATLEIRAMYGLHDRFVDFVKLLSLFYQFISVLQNLRRSQLEEGGDN